jgi:Gluconate 2-dehydrogenase subunit 3
MQNINDLSVIEMKLDRVSRITRRDAARLLAGIAAGAALPLGTAAHPIWKHFEDEHLMSLRDAAKGKLHFLSAEQFESLSALAEAIVPGSTRANVASFIDLLLSVEEKKHQMEFLGSLATLETESNKRYEKRFPALSVIERNELLTAVSTSPKAANSEHALHDAFESLKEWISGGYYSSEVGMRELGWTPDRVFAEFPGCSYDEGHD